MQRIPALTKDEAPATARPVMEQITAKFGKVPNIFATVANSPAALKAMMGCFGALEEGALAGLQHEAIALRVGEMNGCHYCTAAHTAKAKMAGASVEQTLAFRRGRAEDAKLQALLDLAGLLGEKRGALDDDEFRRARDAGLRDEEIMETVAIVALNLFTNTVNALVQTDLDFPEAPELA